MKTATLYWLLLITGVVSEATVINVEEGQNFILECFWPNKDLTFNLFDWKQDGDVEVFMYDAGVHYNSGRSGQDPRFHGRVSHFPEALKDGNASIQIRSAKVKDSGTYTCYFPRADPKRSTKIEVQVGASPKPRLYTAPATPDSLWLFCKVDGAFPEPKVEFLDGAGTRIFPEKNQSLVKDGRYHIEASIHVTKTDNFTCVVTQEQIHHRTSASTFVLTYRSDPSTMDAGHVGLLVAFIISFLLNIVVIVLLRRRTGMKLRRSKGSHLEAALEDTPALLDQPEQLPPCSSTSELYLYCISRASLESSETL